MDYIVFSEWLKNSKHFSERSVRDVVSRCKRVSKIVEQDDINNQTTELLIESESFNAMSVYIKSQLKRAIALYLEFEGKEMN